MADLSFLGEFDATKEAESNGFDPLPEGDYLVAIVESENKENSKKTGKYLSLKLQVLEGDLKGRTLFSNLNLDNPSDVAVGIARAELGAICKAVGLGTVRDSSELHDLPFVVRVGFQKRKDPTDDLRNQIKKYLPRGEYKPAEPASASSGKPPWMK